MNLLVVYYSMYGHTHRMALSVIEGIRSVEPYSKGDAPLS